MDENSSCNNPIGVFDSGLGGLTVVRQLNLLLPCEQILYCADSAHLPYGGKSVEEIQKYTLSCVRELIKKKIKVLLIACHTASIPTKKLIEKEFSIPVFGIQEASLEVLADKTLSQHVGIIGTEATIRSGYYPSELSKKQSQIEVMQVAAPTLVPLIESTEDHQKQIIDELKKYRKAFSDQNIDTLLFACTHYPLILSLFEKTFASIHLVDPSEHFVNIVAKFLEKNGLRAPKKKKVFHEFWVTGEAEHFKKLASRFLSYAPKKVYHLKMS